MKGTNITNIVIAICLGLILLIHVPFFQSKVPKAPEAKVVVHPKAKTVLRYEDYKGYKVPIMANGKGGSYRWIADVPWSAFTIEEKLSMALGGGGWLSDQDIEDIKTKYGVPHGSR